MRLSPLANVQSDKSGSRRDCHSIIAAVIVASFLAQGLFFIFTNSQTYDEAVDLGAGYSYLATGDYRLNQEHPPLMKIVCALPVYLCYQLPFEPSPSDWQNASQWDIGHNFLYASSVHADAILALARIPNLLLGAVLVYTIGLWSCQLWGKPAGLFSMALAAFDPNLIAHSSLVTYDMGVTTFVCLTLYCFWQYSRRPSWTAAIALSLFLGCALASKFSAVSLLGILALAAGGLLVSGNGLLLPISNKHGIDREENQDFRRFFHTIILGCIAVSGATIVVWGTYGFGDITVWWSGLQEVFSHQDRGHSAYLMGQYSQTGWPQYFVIAFLVKTPIGSLLAMAISIGVFWKGKPWSAGAFVTMALPVFLIFAVATQAQINIGLRYILLGYPLLFVAAGRLATFQAKTTRPALITCVVLALGTATSTLWTAPHNLAYFNEFVGGPANGHYYLSDSNIDWGQDLKQLARYIKREKTSTIYLSYFGNAPPEYYGIEYQSFSANSPPPDGMLGDGSADKKPRLLAISLYNLQGIAQGRANVYGWLLERQPIAKIGYSIYVFDISRDADAYSTKRRSWSHDR